MVLRSASPTSNIYLSRKDLSLFASLLQCKHHDQSNKGKERIFCFIIPHCSLSFRKGKARLEAETIKKSCLPYYSPGSRSSGFPMPFRTICLRSSNTHTGLGPPSSMNNQDNPTQTCPWASLILAIPELRHPSQTTLGHVILTVKTKQNTGNSNSAKGNEF